MSTSLDVQTSVDVSTSIAGGNTPRRHHPSALQSSPKAELSLQWQKRSRRRESRTERSRFRALKGRIRVLRRICGLTGICAVLWVLSGLSPRALERRWAVYVTCPVSRRTQGSRTSTAASGWVAWRPLEALCRIQRNESNTPPWTSHRHVDNQRRSLTEVIPCERNLPPCCAAIPAHGHDGEYASPSCTPLSFLSSKRAELGVPRRKMLQLWEVM